MLQTPRQSLLPALSVALGAMGLLSMHACVLGLPIGFAVGGLAISRLGRRRDGATERDLSHCAWARTLGMVNLTLGLVGPLVFLLFVAPLLNMSFRMTNRGPLAGLPDWWIPVGACFVAAVVAGGLATWVLVRRWSTGPEQSMRWFRGIATIALIASAVFQLLTTGSGPAALPAAMDLLLPLVGILMTWAFRPKTRIGVAILGVTLLLIALLMTFAVPAHWTTTLEAQAILFLLTPLLYGLAILGALAADASADRGLASPPRDNA